MKKTGRMMTCERKPERADGFLDAPLVLEMRDAGGAVSRSNGGVHEMLDPGLLGQCREALSLFLFLSTPASQVFLHPEDAPRTGERLAERRCVVKIALDDRDSLALESLCGGTVGLAGHSEQLETAAGEGGGDGATLSSGRASDENPLQACHGALLGPMSCAGTFRPSNDRVGGQDGNRLPLAR